MNSNKSNILLKNIFILLSIVLLSFSSVFAEDIEDTSIIDELEKQEPKQLDFDFNLKTFESCEGLENVMGDYIKEYWKNNKDRWAYPMYRKNMVFSESIDFAMEESMATGDSVESEFKGSSDGGSDDFSETNVQVKGVDESDIIKTDGKYIYYYNESDKYVYIVEKEELKVLKKIKLPDTFYSPVLYLGDNRLIIVSSGYSNTNYDDFGYWINRNSKTYTIVFDTTDIKRPVLSKLYLADGDLKKSRKIGDYLYVVSNNSFNIPYRNFETIDDIEINISKILPKKTDISKTDNKNDQNLKLRGKNLPYNITSGDIAKCDEIEYVLPDAETLKEYDFSPSYNIISVINTNDTSKKVETKVIAGSNAELYMSLENMYLTSYMYQSYDYKCPANSRCFMPWYPRGNNTLIHKINVDENNLKYQDSTIVPGTPLTQYSMDEYKENFRIITSTNTWGEEREQHTNLYILDKDLDLKGSLTNLGEGENFKSSRYIGDKLFLVTFKQIDPLFAIDVADPENPKVLGELKIPGYSTYLHPYDENHLIGLGYDTIENEWGGTMNNGVKVDLYEIDYDRKPEISKTWDEEIKKLINGGCDTIDIDIDGNSCSINEEKTAYDSGCTEMLTTKKLDLPICSSGNFQSNTGEIYISQKFSKTLGEYGSYSEALDNPRMFMWKANENKLFLPATIYTNAPDDRYRHVDFFQGLVTMTIDKDDGIKENFRITHIDDGGLEEERKKECSKYSVEDSSEKCVELIDGSTYCEPVKRQYIPKYCYANSTIGEYISSKYWNYKNSYIKRALWIGNNTYSISNDMIRSSNIDTGIKTGSVKIGK